MRIDELITVKRLATGFASTMVGASASAITEHSAISAEPLWVGAAVKLATLAAGLVTLAAGVIKIWSDIRKDRRDEQLFQRVLSKTDNTKGFERPAGLGEWTARGEEPAAQAAAVPSRVMQCSDCSPSLNTGEVVSRQEATESAVVPEAKPKLRE